jgi:hypothetical protein
MKSLILFDSIGGNTEKVAQRIYNTLKDLTQEVDFCQLSSKIDLEFLDYDLIFLGSPVIDWLPTQRMMNYITKALRTYRDQRKILPSAPIQPGKFGVCFCTYAGPHIGINEALPATMWLGSFLGHIGYAVLDQWHVVGQFHKETPLNTKGRLGNILGRPNDHDLLAVENRTRGVINSLAAMM